MIWVLGCLYLIGGRELSNVDFDSADREILRVLYSTKGVVDAYLFYTRYNLLPSMILRSFRRFEEDGVVRLVDGAFLELTEYGRKWVVSNRRRIFMREVDAEWKDPPGSYLINSLPPFSPYIPKRRNTSKKFFENLASSD